ncbi:cysteine protease [Tulasnella sp. 403]|nr:cysteine protease [Tulasnella sp. 403]
MPTPKAPETPLTLKEADAVLSRAAIKAEEKDFTAALQLYTKAAQAFLHLNRTIETVAPRLSEKEVTILRTQFRDKAAKALQRAEQIKGLEASGGGSSGASRAVSLAPLARNRFSQEEQLAVLDRSSKINGLRFPLWSEPRAEDFTSVNLFIDPDGPIPLSEAQSDKLVSWVRAPEILSTTPLSMSSPHLAVEDIVQSVVTDCSVVAALAVCWNHHMTFGSKLGLSSIYPQDARGVPVLTKNGRYVVRLLMNGVDRQVCAYELKRLVVVDDHLPVGSEGKLLCASTGSKNVLWPSLLEKAYLKVMGGYDFPGSNSSVDLHALIGWIPEHIDLQSSDFRRERTWRRLVDGFNSGRCLVTLATGKHVRQELIDSLLIPSHDYAVLAMEENDASRRVKVYNPWTLHLDPERPRSDELPDFSGLRMDDRRATWVEWDLMCEVFDSLYVNWDPATFSHSCTFHGVWNQDSHLHRRTDYIRISTKGSAKLTSIPRIWVLLERHISHKEEPQHFVALNVMKHASAYTDSTHILSQDLLEEPDLSVVTSLDTEQLPKHTHGDVAYSLFIYSDIDFTLTDEGTDLRYSKKEEGSFTTKTSGGNPSYRTYMNNPQYAVRFQHPNSASSPPKGIPLRLTVECPRRVPINAKLVFAGGRRVADLKQGDIKLDTGPYAYGIATGAGTAKPGDYTLVVSTFEPLKICDFSLRVDAGVPLTLELIPPEGAGMFSKSEKGRWRGDSAAGSPSFGAYHKNPTFTVYLAQPTIFFCRLQLLPPSVAAISATVFKQDTVGVAEGVATTGPYAERVCGVLSEPKRLHGPASYTIIVSTFEPEIEAEFELLMYSSACPITVGGR